MVGYCAHVGDEGDRALARISEVRKLVSGMMDNIDELLPLMTDDQIRALLDVLEGIKRKRERGGRSLN